MSGPQIRALIEDGPRGGEILVIDVKSDKSPPHEILLPSGHEGGHGGRAEDGSVSHPTGAVSTYRLIGPDDERGGFVYKVVHHEK